MLKKYQFGIATDACPELLIEEISHYGKIVYVDRDDLPIVRFFLETDEVSFASMLEDYFFPEGSVPGMYEVRAH